MANKPGINNLFNIFEGMNAFGAGPGARTRSLLDTIDPVTGKPLITQDAIDKANRQSIGTGIVTGLASYLAQPKNKGYGSAVPYLAQSYLQANKAAQAPFQGVADKYLMDTQLTEQQRVLGERTKTQDVINKMILDDPSLGYLNGAPLAQQITAINEKIKLQMSPSKDKLNVKNIDQALYTEPSYMDYASPTLVNGLPNPNYGNTRVLVKTAKAKNEFAIERAKVHKEALNIEKDFSVYKANEFKRANKEFFPDFQDGGVPTRPEDLINKEQAGQAKIDTSGLYGVTPKYLEQYGVTSVGTGETILPVIYNPAMDTVVRQKLGADKPKTQLQMREVVGAMNHERNLISKIINSGDLDKMYGVQSYNPLNKFAGMPAAKLKVIIEQLGNTQFMNNLINSKSQGATFGALSDTEGKRLANILINLNTAQDAQSVEKSLMELDALIARRENSIYENYQGNYGDYDYKKTVGNVNAWTSSFQTEAKVIPGKIKSITRR